MVGSITAPSVLSASTFRAENFSASSSNAGKNNIQQNPALADKNPSISQGSATALQSLSPNAVFETAETQSQNPVDNFIREASNFDPVKELLSDANKDPSGDDPSKIVESPFENLQNDALRSPIDTLKNANQKNRVDQIRESAQASENRSFGAKISALESFRDLSSVSNGSASGQNIDISI